MLLKRLCMGNQAIALGAIRAGVKAATGYPGTPSSEILETIAEEKPPGVYAEWSVNEKSALEVAAGAAIAGARSLVTMKQVGLNVASDPLMSLNYVGVKAGLVVVVADDPGPVSSQTEQDTRHFARFAKLPCFDPSTPEEAYLMMPEAFALSERIGRPVLFRPTTRVCHSYASVAMNNEQCTMNNDPAFAKENGRWVIFPRLAYLNHLQIEDTLDMLSMELPESAGNRLAGAGKKGIAAGGVSWQYLSEVFDGFGAGGKNAAPTAKFLKLATYPLSEPLLLQFLDGLEEVLVCEELDPVIEDELLRLCGKHGLNIKILGKRTGHLPRAGELSVTVIGEAASKFLGTENNSAFSIQHSALPVRAPVLCAGCPHRASFFAVKEAMRGRPASFSGDIGCYTLGNAPPLDMVDTCLCMGAGITQAQGLGLAEPSSVRFAFAGDSTLFHTGLPGIVNAVYNRHDIVVCVLDNATTAMTGGQPHPGMPRTLMGEPARAVDAFAVVKAMGVDVCERVNAFDLEACKKIVKEAADQTGVRVIFFEGPCINLVKKGEACVITEKCTNCGVCVKKLGCPALSQGEACAAIDETLCTGCGLCAQVCPFGAIEGGASCD